MATVLDGQPGQPDQGLATDTLLREILLELRTLNRKLEVRDAEPTSSDEVSKSRLETSLLDMAEGTTPEAGTLDSEDEKEESDTGGKLEGPELASGAEIPSNSEAEGKTSENVTQGSEAGTRDSEDGKEESDTGRKLEGPEPALGANIPSNSEAEGETFENVAEGSKAGVEMALVDLAELLTQGAEDSLETEVKEEVEMLESLQGDGEVARGGAKVDWSELEVVSTDNFPHGEAHDISKKPGPIHRYHWDYPWSSESEKEREKKTAGFPVTEDIRDMWSNYIGCNWAIPPDKRVGLSFDSWTLRRDADHGKERLEKLTNALRQFKGSKLGNNSFQITDYHYPSKKVQYFYQNNYRTAIVPEEILSRVNFCWESDWGQIWQAPWGRLIESWGVGSTVPPTAGVFDAFPWFHENAEGDDPSIGITSQSLSPYLDAHLKCIRTINQNCLGSSGHFAFHLTFYEVIGPTSQASMFENKMWKAGPLHSDNFDYWDLANSRLRFSQLHHLSRFHESRHLETNLKASRRYFRESAVTIVASAEHHPGEKPLSLSFWTFIVLAPKTWNDTTYGIEGEGIRDDEDVPCFGDMMSRLVLESIGKVYGRWTSLEEYLEKLFSGRSTLLDPQHHDALLSDDEAFSRSKTYFWAINLLRDVDKCLQANITALKHYDRVWHNDRVWSRCQPGQWIENFQAIQVRFRDLREEAKALRDGLFSASSVMESRASTRLGENVKLLTYVSIFFLPLSFCMSIWSINNTLFSLRSLIITATVIAMTTYIIVFNMNNIGSLLSMTKSSYWQHAKKDFGGKTLDEDSSPVGKDNDTGTTRVLKRMRFWRSGTVGGDPDV